MRFHHIGITVNNLDESLEFYKSLFGFKEVKRFTKDGWDGEAIILKLGKIKLELFYFNNPNPKKDDYSDLKTIGIKHFGLVVKNIDKIYQRLKSNNIDIDEPQAGTTCEKFCFLRDPNGISIELIQE